MYREGDKLHGELGERQLAFIRNDLAHVPANYLVVLAMHIPVVGSSDKEALYAIVQERSHLFMIAAHWHGIEQFFLGPEDGWNGAAPLHLYVPVATCASWWTGFKDESGIPHSTMRDGSPNGYTVLSVDAKHREQTNESHKNSLSGPNSKHQKRYGMGLDLIIHIIT